MLGILFEVLKLLLMVVILVVILAAAIGIVIARWTWLPKVLHWIADFNEWWSCFKPLPLEGEMLLITKGSKVCRFVIYPF